MLLLALPVFLTVLFVIQDLAHGAYSAPQRAIFAVVVLVSFIISLKGLYADRTHKSNHKR